MSRLDTIFKYKMDAAEAKAFKLALLWQDLTIREFPKYSHIKLRKSGDPRKSVLFKYCYKLARETKGLIKDSEYHLYILAQLRIMDQLRYGDVHALIDPVILTGEKAWKRWKYWKYQNDQRIKLTHKNVEELGILPSLERLEKEFKQTKEFLKDKIVPLTKDEIEKTINNRIMHGWITLQKVSPYFIILSPLVSIVSPNEVFDRDFGVYPITDEVEVLFKKVFK